MAATARTRTYQHQDLWDKVWKNDHGEYVIWQRPNIWLIGWAVLTVVSLFLNGAAFSLVWYVALAVLAVWSLLEIFKGANYFRRALGAVVLLAVIAMVFKVGY